MRRRTERGFTLMELLVALGIIVVLMAITLPMLLHAKEDTLITVCLSNLRQLGIATELYGTENDDYLPWNGERWGRGARWWRSRVVFPTGLDCPARTEEDKSRRGRLGYSTAISNWTKPEYLAGVDLPGVQVPDSPIRFSMISFPAKKVQTFELSPWHFEGEIWEPAGVPKGEISQIVHAPGDRSPLSFMDGHARRFDYTKIRDGWHPGTSWVWRSSIHGTVDGYRGRDIK